MKIALLGGIGYMGGRLAQHLSSQHHHVRITTRRPLRSVPPWVSADEVIHDTLQNSETLKKHLADRDAIIHLASPDEKAAALNPRDALKAGGETVWNVLEAIAALRRPPLFIFLSTFHVYGRRGQGRITEQTLPVPSHPYGLGRYMGENVTQVFRRHKGIRALCVRMSNVVGSPVDIRVPRWTLIGNDLCLQSVTQRKLMVRSPPSIQRNFISMEDAVRAIEFLVCRPSKWPKDGVLHLGSPKSMTLDQLAQQVARCSTRTLGYTPPIVHLSKDNSAAAPLRFSVQRLKDMGFSWENSMEAELTQTLKMCSEAYRKWGPKIFQMCGLNADRPSGFN